MNTDLSATFEETSCSHKRNSQVKPSAGTRYLLAVFSLCLGLMPVDQSRAQTLKTLYIFTKEIGFTTFGAPINSDGASPSPGLVLSGSTLYGTAATGGDAGVGTVFKVNTDGTGFTVLHTFSGGDGVNPAAGMVLSGTVLYGTTTMGGDSNLGTVFKVNTDGTGFTSLHSFSAEDGAWGPWARLVLSGNTLYGTTARDGNPGTCTIFKVNTDGTGYTSLYSFGPGVGLYAGLTLSQNVLYGATVGGGDFNRGTIFRVDTDGTEFMSLYSFTGGDDGVAPYAEPIVIDGTLYGPTLRGGKFDKGTVFRVNTDGTGFSVLHHFDGNGDGADLGTGLTLSQNVLYGATSVGGEFDRGTAFKVDIDGSRFTVLHSFTGESGEGASPEGDFAILGSTLYGTTSAGGSSGNGTVFSLSLGAAQSPQITLVPSGQNFILTWPADATGFTLQSTTNLVSPVWSTVDLIPVIANGQNTVTTPFSGTQRFFRLSQ